jgi:hypothetical protein
MSAVDVDAVEQQAADLAQVPLDHAGRAAALARAVAVVAALAPVQITTERSIKLECPAFGSPQVTSSLLPVSVSRF